MHDCVRGDQRGKGVVGGVALGVLRLCLSCGGVKDIVRPPYCEDCRAKPIDALVETTKGVEEMGEIVRVVTAVGDPNKAQFAMYKSSGNIVQVRFEDGFVAEFDAEWLRRLAEQTAVRA